MNSNHPNGKLIRRSTAKMLMLATALGLILCGHGADAATISLNWESETAGSTSVPSGWSYVATGMATGSGIVSYATSAAGGGSPNTGLGGILRDDTVVTHTGRLPHNILVNSGSPVGFDVNQNISGTYDFKHTNNTPPATGFDGYTSSAFLFGDIQNPLDINGTSAGQLLEFFHSRNNFGNAPSSIENGAQATVTSKAGYGFLDNTWYRVAFTWTATGSNTGNFAATSTRWDGSAFVAHNNISHNGFVFNSNEAYIGFADLYSNTPLGVTFDNISVTGTLIVIPEPSTALLSGLGLLGLLLRRRR